MAAYLEQQLDSDGATIVANLSLLRRGAAFLVAKLRREKKI